jgi:hypothetical protein
VRNVFGGTIGGPILKNRLFFFFNYEGQRQSLQQSVLRNIPTASLDDGVIQYQCSVASQCPGGSVTGESGASYTVQPGYYGLTPGNLAQMDPLGIGPSQVALTYFHTYPLPNDYTVGNLVNFAGYRFAAPTLTNFNWYIGRLDYKLSANGNHTLFFRGAARNDPSIGAPFLPGTAPEYSSIDVSKGFVAGYTGVFGPHWVNNVRYGITHQSIASPGDSNELWVGMRGLDEPNVYGSAFTAPVHNLVDTVSWAKGSHNFQFGTNILFIRRTSDSTGTSFSDGLTNSDWLQYSGLANENDPLNPAYGCTNSGPCYPAVASGFDQGYDWPLTAMMGIVSEVDARYNYHVDSLTTASPIAQGAPVSRHWATDTYSLFFQDTWHARPNLSITYGLNYQLMTPITETNGQEVTPSVNMGDWFNQRASDASKGIPSNQDPVIAFSPAGSVWGRPGLYQSQRKNFAPRVGFSWSLGDKTVIRAGAGMYFDSFGPALAMTYDAGGTFGLSTLLTNPPAILTPGTPLTPATAPRLTSMNAIPANRARSPLDLSGCLSARRGRRSPAGLTNL